MMAGVLDPVCDLGLVEELVEEVVLAGRSFVRQADLLVELARRAERDGHDEFVAAEVSCALKVDTGQARSRIAEAQALAARPLTRQALYDGRITVRHAQVIGWETEQLAAGLVAAVEERVLGRAGDQTPSQLRASVRRAVLRVDAEAAERRRRAARRTAGVWLRAEPDGMALVCLRMAAEQAVAATETLAAVTPQAEPGDDRSAGERTVDAFCSLVDGLLALGLPGKAGARAAVQVTVPFATAAGRSDEPCELRGYGPITAQAGRALLANAELRRVCVDETTGLVIAVDAATHLTGPGPQPRGAGTAGKAAVHTALSQMLRPAVRPDLATGGYRPGAALTRLVQARDVTCTFPFCGRSASRCDLEHETPWPYGPTDPGNVDSKCRFHHRTKQAGWEVRRQPDGSTRWWSRAGAGYWSRPPTDPPPPPR